MSGLIRRTAQLVLLISGYAGLKKDPNMPDNKEESVRSIGNDTDSTDILAFIKSDVFKEMKEEFPVFLIDTEE